MQDRSQTMVVALLALFLGIALGITSGGLTEHLTCPVVATNVPNPPELQQASLDCWAKITGNDGWRIARTDKPLSDSAGSFVTLERSRIRFLGG